MSTPNPDDPQRWPPGSDEQTPPSRHVAGILWTLAFVALISLGIWWYVEQARMDPPPPAAAVEAPPPVVDRQDAPVTAREAGIELEGDEPDDAAVATQPAAPTKAPAPVASIPRDRGPEPLTSNRHPEYPARALRSGVQGSVSVLIQVNAQGLPTDVRVVSRRGERSRDLDQAVVRAARSWRFEPALRGGRPVSGEVIVPVEFQQDQGSAKPVHSRPN